MAKISTYPLDQTPSLLDKVIGTDEDGSGVTSNYLISDIVGLTPASTLDEVLSAGNTSAQDITLSGVSTFSDTLAVTGTLTDESGLSGTTGQVLSSVGTNVEWIDIPVQPVNLTSVLKASSFVNQMPSGLGVPLQVTFGSAQGTVSDPVQIDEYGLIRFNEVGTYFLSGYANVQRIGSNGGFCRFLYRFLVNSLQHGITKGVDLTNTNEMLPLETSELIEVTSPATVGTFEIMRDLAGVNQGSLITQSASAWSSIPSASIYIQKLN